jgi:hypothetical protein
MTPGLKIEEQDDFTESEQLEVPFGRRKIMLGWRRAPKALE